MATIDGQGVRIEYVSLAELRRWPRNPKGHDLGAIHESYDRFGYVMPMLLDEHSGRLAVGHGRLDALQQRKASGEEAPGGIRASDGAWSVPVVRGVSFGSDAEMDAYIVADNRLTELGGWDEAGLAAMLADLAAGEEGLRGVGFDEDDLDALLASLASEPEPDPGAQIDRAAELQEKWQVETGDLWEIGAHRLVCGDCTDGAVVARVMGGKKAQAVVTDPPFNVGFDYKTGFNDKKSLDDYGRWLWHALELQEAQLVEPWSFFIWQAILTCHYWSEWFPRDYRLFASIRGWAQYLPTSIQFSWDPVLFWSCGASTVRPQAGRRDYFISTPSHQQGQGGGEHPCPRPFDACHYIVGELCEPGIIIDPFLGSGTTMVACEQLHRRCFGIEIHPPYVSVCLERLAGMGLEPRRVE